MLIAVDNQQRQAERGQCFPDLEGDGHARRQAPTTFGGVPQHEDIGFWRSEPYSHDPAVHILHRVKAQSVMAWHLGRREGLAPALAFTFTTAAVGAECPDPVISTHVGVINKLLILLLVI